MEVIVPLFALSSLYFINNQNNKKKVDNFSNQYNLPNTNVPDENYPVDPNDTEKTAELSVNNKYDNGGGVYTDKYFNQQPVAESSSGSEYTSLDGCQVGK